jgi:hypothetical protein
LARQTLRRHGREGCSSSSILRLCVLWRGRCVKMAETKREEAVPGILIKNCHSSVEVVPRRRGSRGYFWHQGSPCASGLNCLGDARFVVRTKWFQACGVARIASGEKLCGLGVPAQYVPRAALLGPIHLSRAPISTFPTPIFFFSSLERVRKKRPEGRGEREDCENERCMHIHALHRVVRRRWHYSKTRGACTYALPCAKRKRIQVAVE